MGSMRAKFAAHGDNHLLWIQTGFGKTSFVYGGICMGTRSEACASTDCMPTGIDLCARMRREIEAYTRKRDGEGLRASAVLQ